MYPEALLLDEGVRSAGVELQTGGQGNRAKRAVRGDSHVVCLGHGGYLADLENAPRVREIGLNYVGNALIKDLFEIPAGKEPLAGSDRCRGVSRYLGEGFPVLRKDRLLDEEQPEPVELPGKYLCHALVDPAVKIDGDPEVLSAGFTDRPDAFQYSVDLLV